VKRKRRSALFSLLVPTVLRLPNGAIRYLGRFSARLHVHTSSLSSLLSSLSLSLFFSPVHEDGSAIPRGDICLESRCDATPRRYFSTVSIHFTRDAIVATRWDAELHSSPSIFIDASTKNSETPGACATLYRAPLIISENTSISVVERWLSMVKPMPKTGN